MGTRREGGMWRREAESMPTSPAHGRHGSRHPSHTYASPPPSPPPIPPRPPTRPSTPPHRPHAPVPPRKVLLHHVAYHAGDKHVHGPAAAAAGASRHGERELPHGDARVGAVPPTGRLRLRQHLSQLTCDGRLLRDVQHHAAAHCGTHAHTRCARNALVQSERLRDVEGSETRDLNAWQRRRSWYLGDGMGRGCTGEGVGARARQNGGNTFCRWGVSGQRSFAHPPSSSPSLPPPPHPPAWRAAATGATSRRCRWPCASPPWRASSRARATRW